MNEEMWSPGCDQGGKPHGRCGKLIRAAALFLVSTAVAAEQSPDSWLSAGLTPNGSAAARSVEYRGAVGFDVGSPGHRNTPTDFRIVRPGTAPWLTTSYRLTGSSVQEPDGEPAAVPKGNGWPAWLPWFVAGGIVLLIAGLAAGSADTGGGEPLPDIGPPPGVGGGDPPSLPTLGPVVQGPPQDTPDRPGDVPDRLEQLRRQQGVFFSTGVSFLERQETPRTLASTSETDFLALGYDRVFGTAFNGGLFVELSRSDTEIADSDDAQANRSRSLVAFADRQVTPRTRVSAYLGAARLDSTRIRFSDGQGVTFVVDGGGGASVGGGLTEEARIDGALDVEETLMGVSAAHELPRWRRIETDLRLHVDYRRTRLGAYRESGDSALELAYPAQVQESLTARLGIGFLRPIGTARGVLIPQLGLDLIHEAKDEARRIVATLAADPTFVSVTRTDDPDTGYASASASLAFVAPRGAQVYVGHERIFQHVLQDTSTFSVGARIEF